ncbi:MAG: GatB/YqeY domain-containing protein [Geothrix sp.]|uniref:GatB/YqeY domain-containing protein n=1 Tax=Geothrix sp. TaxID=1962974 RepID=UPI0018160D60|nr:GatB/YqeY domain-containing protein [Geothrix sp.]NWJ39858.1 GatB/YqeY domain-containing protein [Geothrix sp.]WIL22129.1 MAG: GatB/YqeY domain-containing protein [Geothrix sp.]
MLIRLQADLKTAMLARDAARTQVLRMALAAYKNEAVAKGLGPQGTLPEAEAIAVFKRLVKSREDSVAQFEKVGQAERAAQERQEIELLKPYLPAMIEGPALEAAVKEAIASSGASSKKDMGLVMKALQAAHGTAYDGKAASILVQSLLA